eukprot:TRINITY_DN93457_c0_g1_i1.p2 TRINITY_DN93457_c0_g1~~TRINITY_DN93457_c0_g1_i1.p2  ORF type:complete len:124 (+),score=16.99 TRINITY_DN93457_c0_g1_i1:85-456(+)
MRTGLPKNIQESEPAMPCFSFAVGVSSTVSSCFGSTVSSLASLSTTYLYGIGFDMLTCIKEVPSDAITSSSANKSAALLGQVCKTAPRQRIKAAVLFAMALAFGARKNPARCCSVQYQGVLRL